MTNSLRNYSVIVKNDPSATENIPLMPPLLWHYTICKQDMETSTNQKPLFLNLLKKGHRGSWPPKRGGSTLSPLKATKHPGLTDDTDSFPLLWSIVLEVLSTTKFMVVLRTRSWFWQSSSQLAADHRPPHTYGHASATTPPAAFWRWAGSPAHNRWDQSRRFPDISAAWRNTSASVTTGDRVCDAPVG